MNKVNIKDSQNFITSKYHIEKIMMKWYTNFGHEGVNF